MCSRASRVLYIFHLKITLRMLLSLKTACLSQLKLTNKPFYSSKSTLVDLEGEFESIFVLVSVLVLPSFRAAELRFYLCDWCWYYQIFESRISNLDLPPFLNFNKIHLTKCLSLYIIVIEIIKKSSQQDLCPVGPGFL